MSINLMPWREERRRKLQKDFLTRLGLSALVGLGAVVLLYIVFSAQVSGQNKRIAFLNQNIDEAKKSIEQIKELEKEKQAMLNRKKVIENLQANRDLLAHVYYELAKNSVDGVLLNSMEYKNTIMEIKGKSISNSAVAAFMNKIQASPWFDKPEIVVIQNDDLTKGNKTVNISDPSINRYGYDFTVKTGIKNPNAPPTDEEIEAEKNAKKSSNRRKRK